jgi:BirA family biotin operon repressor/biotin-[acetyl-CoA-carboxylase] ligase
MASAEFTSSDFERIERETFVERLEWHAELPSTNDRVLEPNWSANADGPVLVLVDRQTAGRGRGANRWWSQTGALTFSLVLNTAERNLPMDRWPQVSLTTGLAICQAVEALLPEADIGLKWPNDVFLQSRKVCGILVEVHPGRAGQLVIGIGLNVNNSFADAPSEMREIATSLRDEAEQSFSLADVLVDVLQRIEREVLSIDSESSSLMQRFQQRCVLTGRTVELTVGEQSTVGVCHGIDADGAIVLWTGEQTERFYGGVVSRYE